MQTNIMNQISHWKIEVTMQISKKKKKKKQNICFHFFKKVEGDASHKNVDF